MSTPNIASPTPSEPSPSTSSSTKAPDAVTAGNIAAGTQGSGSYTAATKVSTMASLRKVAPKIYRAMEEGLATNICRESQDHIERFKKLMREGYQNS